MVREQGGGPYVDDDDHRHSTFSWRNRGTDNGIQQEQSLDFNKIDINNPKDLLLLVGILADFTPSNAKRRKAVHTYLTNLPVDRLKTALDNNRLIGILLLPLHSYLEKAKR